MAEGLDSLALAAKFANDKSLDIHRGKWLLLSACYNADAEIRLAKSRGIPALR
jgi:hypothetical protein